MRVINLLKQKDKYVGFQDGYHRINRSDGGIEFHRSLKIIRPDGKVVYYNEDGTSVISSR